MFVQNLNDTQQSYLLALSKELIGIDGELDEKELAMLQILKSQCNDGIEEIDVDFEMLTTVFEDQIHKTSLLLELIGLAYSDSEFHETEKKWLEKLIGALGIENSKYQKMVTWVEAQMKLVVDAQELMEA
ncbi:MAG: TerB family tellurite resistance protein [Pseudomonadota bacterium]|nr:TerB family tellurite resistance protein [Pseudomonadota bacterium]